MKGGAVVEVVVRDHVPDVRITMRNGVPPHRFTVYFRGEKLGEF